MAHPSIRHKAAVLDVDLLALAPHHPIAANQIVDEAGHVGAPGSALGLIDRTVENQPSRRVGVARWALVKYIRHVYASEKGAFQVRATATTATQPRGPWL
jgi:hypothetical protein